MKSSWPIVMWFCAIALAAVWYDARNAEASAREATPAQAAATLVAGK